MITALIVGMDSARLLGLFDTDFQLLRSAVAAVPADAPVPGCPGWTVADLAKHTAEVYLHKAACIRLGEYPKPWPPEQPDLPPAEILEAAYVELTEQFAGHEPGDHAATWYEPDQTVGFWIRRMAQETVIHRVDAELAADREVSPIADDLALDGVDEIVELFFGYGSRIWRSEYGTLLDAPDDRPVIVAAGDAAWSVRATAEGFVVAALTEGDSREGAASVSGDPVSMLLWLWNRAGDETVTLAGDSGLLEQFHALRAAGTQ